VQLQAHFEDITYVSYFTVSPSPNNAKRYLEKVKDELLTRTGDELWILGRQTGHMVPEELPERVSIYAGLNQLLASEAWKPIEG
jgi:hypothetical protein